MPRLIRTFLFAFAVLLAACSSLAAQGALGQLLGSKPAAAPKTSSDPLGRDTPYGTVFGFLEAAQSGKYSIAAQYLQMSSAQRRSEGEALSQKLKAVMDASFSGSLKNVSTQPEGRPQEGVPSDRQPLGMMVSGDAEAELELARVSDPNAGKIWLIDSETLARIPELFDQVEARQMETRLPGWVVKHQFAGMPLWQWFALLILIPVAGVLAWVLLRIGQVPMHWWARRHGHVELESRRVSGAAWLLLGTLIHRILAEYLGMPLLQRHYYTQVTTVALIIAGNWILWRVVRWFLGRVRGQALAHGHGGTGSLMLLGERIIKFAIFVMAVFFVFATLGFNMSTALAGLGIGTLAIGFGAQQTIANLFGGVSVLVDELFRVGDLCKFGDRSGTVEDIGLRSTRVRTDERTLLAIPNGTVATINVENLSRRDKILFKTILGLHLDTTSDQVSAVLDEIRRVLAQHSKIEKATTRVRLIELAAAAINVELVCYVLTRDFEEFAAVREEVLLRIMNRVEESGTSLAQPSQTLYLRSDSDDKAKTALHQLADSGQDKQQAASDGSKQKPDAAKR
ncbi:MAG TPA: mechanosensitive ion channel family protein [Candidatus Sulfotelmatobacter sp.]